MIVSCDDSGSRARVNMCLSTRYTRPRTALERELAELWGQRLGVTPIGVDDDFFELGGHSLAAVELLEDITARLGIEVKAETLFLEPSIAELAAAITAASGPGRVAEAD